MDFTAVAPAVRQLVGYDNFKRSNPKSDKFEIFCFHHIEFYCSDSTNVSRRFSHALGMPIVATSNVSSGNMKYCSTVIQSHSLCFTFTAPYGKSFTKVMDGKDTDKVPPPHPGYDQEQAHNFVGEHGLAVRAVAIRVADAAEAYEISTKNGAVGAFAPHTLVDKESGKSMVMSEIKMFGDVVIRWVSGQYQGPMLPNYTPTPSPPTQSKDSTFGIMRLDHSVSNVPNLFEAVDYLLAATGMHEFAEFCAADIGTLDSGLNSMVLASNNEMVLLPVNEPTFGTKRQSQIQTFLDHNNGEGLQHLALLSGDIFATVRQMRERGASGFEFMAIPSPEYYAKVTQRIGKGVLSESQMGELQELGILADRDDQGVLLQIFTKPVGDRMTLFIEIIQRIGCDVTPEGVKTVQAAGCGGFGKGNFAELFKSIEDFEKSQEGAQVV